MSQTILTFHSLTNALRSDKLLSTENIPYQLIPVPLKLSGSCHGMAITCSNENKPAVIEILNKNGIQVKHEYDGDELK